tara:strand:+ start:254 stop:421 length:168 start_codon:yes stop_codon:yes gene_type:complete
VPLARCSAATITNVYQHQTKGGLWANPGDIMGRFGTISYGLFETDSLKFEHIIVS